MPHLDGFELTAAIRSGEVETSDRLPIIAITANALQGEGARCLAEGMDDYLTKPIAMEALTESLWRWVGPSRSRESSPGQPSPPTAPRAMDRSADEDAHEVVLDTTILEATLRGDRATARMLLGDFVPNAQALVERAVTAVGSGDIEEIARVGHTLKSSARAVGALQLGTTCELLEQVAGTRVAQQMGPDVERLQLAFERMRDAVHDVLAGDTQEAP